MPPKRKAEAATAEKSESSTGKDESDAASSKRPRKVVDYSEGAIAAAVSANEAKAGKNGVSAADISASTEKVEIYKHKEKEPTRDKDGNLHFQDFPDFTPNLTPKEILQMGSFGGTYFRPIQSKVTKVNYGDEVWKEFPSDWFENLRRSQYASSTYNNHINTYKVHCGADLDEWESKGWMRSCDPYGWFQWYCRFYLGRRCSDDERQVGRGIGVMGAKGRWRSNLTNKCLLSNKSPQVAVDDIKISPVIRQTLQHWGFRLTAKHLIAAAAKKK